MRLRMSNTSLLLIVLVVPLPAVTGINCTLPGLCDGYLLSADQVEDKTQCIYFCREQQDCHWWSWNEDNKICDALLDCPVVDESKTGTVSGERECSEFSCNMEGQCQGVLVDSILSRSKNSCLQSCQQEPLCHWFTFFTETQICLLLQNCNALTDDCQEECHLDSPPLQNLFTGKYYNSDYYFEMININNSSLPTQTVPDYPFPVEHPDFVIFDPRAGVVRACGGNIPNKENVKDSQTDKCFTFNGFEWQPMESLVLVPDGWWILVTEYSSSYSNLLLDNGTWVSGPPPLATEERHDSPCGAQLNSTHTMLTGGQFGYDGSSLAQVWLFDWTSQEWKTSKNMTRPRREHSCTSISGGRVVVAGGIGLYGEELNDIEIFDPAADGGQGGWYSGGELPDHYHSEYYTDLLYNGKNWVFLSERDIWIYDESEATWTEFGKDLTGYVGRYRSAMIPDDFFRI